MPALANLSGFETPDLGWTSYEGGNSAQHYSRLAQINKDNVQDLEVAWSYELAVGTSVSNPLIIDGIMYIVGSGAAIVVS